MSGCQHSLVTSEYKILEFHKYQKIEGNSLSIKISKLQLITEFSETYGTGFFNRGTNNGIRVGETALIVRYQTMSAEGQNPNTYRPSLAQDEFSACHVCYVYFGINFNH